MKDDTILFSGVGDISIGDHPLCVGFGGYSQFKDRDASFPFENVKRLFSESDLVFGNLECTLSNRDVRDTDYNSVQMRGAPRFCAGLADAGFDIVNMANNHSMQHGKDAFRETVDLLSAHDIQTTGVNFDDHLTGAPTFVRKNGINIAFLGYSLRPRQYFEYEPYYSEGNEQNMISDVAKTGEEADIVIVSLHWGDEFIQRPSPEEIRIARSLIDAGANLIIGHHPHVLRGLEAYNGGFIAYSLGNFVCDMIWDDTLRETAIFQCDISKGGVNNARFIPCFVNDHYQPTPLQGPAADALHAKLAALSRQIEKETLTDFDTRSAAYVVEADERHRLIRKKGHFYFLRSVWRFSPRILLQQFRRFFVNRFQELTQARSQAGSH